MRWCTVEKFETDLDGEFLSTIHLAKGPRMCARVASLGARTDEQSGQQCSGRQYVPEHNKNSAKVRRAGEDALQVLSKTREPAIVLLGRPYNIYDRAACCDIPRKLRALYGINVVPLDFLPLAGEDVLRSTTTCTGTQAG